MESQPYLKSSTVSISERSFAVGRGAGLKNDAVHLKGTVLFLAAAWVICLCLGFVVPCVGSDWCSVINAGVAAFVRSWQINPI